MTIAQVLKKYKLPDTELLLAHTLKQPREFLYLNPRRPIPTNKLRIFSRKYLDLKKGIPLAYIVGHKGFYGLDFKVNKNVLIPRPESEWLVDQAIECAKKKHKKPKILDIGTGSGNIIISIAKNMGSKAKYYASDISTGSLRVAKHNSKVYKAKIQFTHSNLFQNIPGKFHLITANLPYVPMVDFKKLYKNLKYEPVSALTDGSNNNKLITKLLDQLISHLEPEGLAFVELDPTSKKYIKNHIKKKNLPLKADFFKDYNHLVRYAKISLS